MSEMIQRGAQAMLAGLGYPDALDLSDPYRRIITIHLSSADIMGCVQAVIEAMREPTKAMKSAMHDSDYRWKLGIDAALADKQP
jgi:hypothetical protein